MHLCQQVFSQHLCLKYVLIFQALESQIIAYEEKVLEAQKVSAAMQEDKNFMADEITQQIAEIVERYRNIVNSEKCFYRILFLSHQYHACD